MKNLFNILVFIISFGVQSQTGLYIDGSALHIQNNTLLYVNGDIEVMPAGTIDDSGRIEITRHWINTSGGTGLINNSPGTVDMLGGNQYIAGDSRTHFYNLNLLGGSVTKEAFVDARITNQLNINNAELEVHDNTVHLSNPSPSSLTWVNGYIAGDSIGGYFARSTNRRTAYKYPVGNSSLLSSFYRPVELTPIGIDSNVYGVRLAATDATFDNTGTSFSGATGPYDLALRDPSIVDLNDQFYHHIVRMHGSSAVNTELYFFDGDHPSQEKRFDGLAQWNGNTPSWEFESVSLNANINGPSDMGSPDYSVNWLLNNFDDDAFSLAVLEGILVFVPQIFSPNGDGANDVLFVRGRKVQKLRFIVYNRWGEKVFETTDKNIGWDGQFRGAKAQSSVYVYYLDAEIEDFGRLEQKGNITLVR